MLGLLLTAVKLLFVEGAVGPAAELAQVVAPAVAASDAPLHTTHIRNEVAFFRCIQKVTAGLCGDVRHSLLLSLLSALQWWVGSRLLQSYWLRTCYG